LKGRLQAINAERIIIIVRHGESIKNRKGIHGGSGESLTEEGRAQVKNVASLIQSQIGKKRLETAAIFSPNNIQAVESAELFSICLGTNNYELLSIESLNMGVAHGITQEELRRSYPSAASSLDLWRNRQIDISQLAVPGMGDPLIFYNLGLQELQKIRCNDMSIVVCTSSLFILFTNILLKKNVEPGGNYLHIPIDNCDLVAFSVDETETILLPELTTVSIEWL